MKQRVADVFAERLRAAGCSHAFGIPGGEVLTLMDALGEAGIEFILAKHENCAGFMAEGVYRRSNAPGILLATIGPGVANAVNVVANAEQDRVPLIFLTGCVDACDALTYNHQVFDHAAVLKPITKASFTATSEGCDVLIDKALAIAQTDPPGPVHIDVPINVANSRAVLKQQRPRARPGKVGPAPGPELDQARQWLGQARRPLAVVGQEVLAHRAEQAVADFLCANTIPLITTYRAKGVLDENHNLALGGAGLSPQADRVLLPLLAQSDCILLLGYDPIEMRTGWRNPWPEDARVVEFSAQPNAHDMHQASLSFIGDIGAAVASLANGSASSWTADELDAIRAKLDAIYRPNEDWGPAAAVTTIRRALPPQTVATVDSGAHRILLSQVWRAPLPRRLLQSTGLCTMGCALPLAIGAKLADADNQTPVVAFSGDAGLEMVLGELATLRELKLPVIVVVFVDRSLALIELKQRGLQLANRGVDFSGTDFVAVARALGGQGFWADSRDTLRYALEQAQAVADKFSLIACELAHPAYDGRI